LASKPKFLALRKKTKNKNAKEEVISYYAEKVNAYSPQLALV